MNEEHKNHRREPEPDEPVDDLEDFKYLVDTYLREW